MAFNPMISRDNYESDLMRQMGLNASNGPLSDQQGASDFGASMQGWGGLISLMQRMAGMGMRKAGEASGPTADAGAMGTNQGNAMSGGIDFAADAAQQQRAKAVQPQFMPRKDMPFWWNRAMQQHHAKMFGTTGGNYAGPNGTMDPNPYRHPFTNMGDLSGQNNGWGAAPTINPPVPRTRGTDTESY